MTNNIFKNYVIRQQQELDTDNDKNTLEEIFQEIIGDIEEEQKKFKEQSSLADAAAKAAEYKEVTPQMAGGNPPETEGEQQQTEGTKSDAAAARAIADQNLDQVLGINDAAGARAIAEQAFENALGITNDDKLPSLEDLLKGIMSPNIHIDIDILSDDNEADIVIAEKMGITTEDLFERGTQAGLSPLQIINNLNIIRSSVALEGLTSDKLNSQDLNDLYIASLNNDTDTVDMILSDKNITLGDDFSTNDILELSQKANTAMFKSVYLN